MIKRKNLGWLVIVLLSLVCVVCFARGEEKKVKVKLLWEKKLNEIEGMVKKGKLKKLKQQGKKPNAIRVGKGVILFDDEGDIVGMKGMEPEINKHVFTSDYGSYTLDVEIKPWDERDEIEVEAWDPRSKTMKTYKTQGVKYTLMDDEGNIVSSKINLAPDSYGVFISDEDGTMAAVNFGIDGTHRIVQLYDKYGNFLNQYDSWRDSNVKEFIGYQGAWSENGEYFAFLHDCYGCPESARKSGRKTFLILFDKRGSMVWKKELKGEVAYHILISKRGNYIVASAGDIYLFDKNGTILKSFDIPAYPHISSDGYYIALVQRSEILLYSILSNKILWKEQFPSSYRINTVDILNRGKYIAVGGITEKDNRTSSPKFVYIFDRNGKEIFKRIDLYKIRKPYLPERCEVKISKNGRYILFFNENKMWLFENISERK